MSTVMANSRSAQRPGPRLGLNIASGAQSGLNSILTTLPLENETMPQSELNAPSLECRKISESRITISPDGDVEYCEPLPTTVNVVDVLVGEWNGEAGHPVPSK